MGLPYALPRAAAAAVLAALVLCGPAPAQGPAHEYVPEVGQDGKDVVWVPTAQTLVEKMLDMAKVTPDDYVIDLGSGDGRTVITAARRGAKALGIEFNPKMAELARRNAERAGVADKARFVEGDIFASDFSEATVLTLFLLPDLNRRLMPTILAMKPGTRVVSNSFSMGDWRPDKTAEVIQDCKTHCRALLWIVPAKVEGAWELRFAGEPAEYLLSLNQTQQFFTGSISIGDKIHFSVRGRLDGSQVTYTVPDHPLAPGFELKGEVNDNRMGGSSTAAGKPAATWSAMRKTGP